MEKTKKIIAIISGIVCVISLTALDSESYIPQIIACISIGLIALYVVRRY